MHIHSCRGFQLMALCFMIRELFRPPERILEEMGLKPGRNVLDYGCGSGSRSLAAARLVGQGGKVYAAVVNPLARRWIKKIPAVPLGKGKILRKCCGMPRPVVDPAKRGRSREL